MEQLPNQSSEIGELIAALAKAQPELRNPHKNKQAHIPGRPYMYADLGEIVDSYRLPLAKQGIIVLTQLGVNSITVKIAHSSGQWMASTAPIFESKDIKVFGANITYNRRYLTEGLIGLAAQEDIDGDPDSGTLSDQGSQYKNQLSPSQSPVPTVKPKDPQATSHTTKSPSLPPIAHLAPLGQPKPVTNYSPEVQPIVDRVKALVSEGRVSQTEVAEMILEMGKPAIELTKFQWQEIFNKITDAHIWKTFEDEAQWRMIYDKVYKD